MVIPPSPGAGPSGTKNAPSKFMSASAVKKRNRLEAMTPLQARLHPSARLPIETLKLNRLLWEESTQSTGEGYVAMWRNQGLKRRRQNFTRKLSLIETRKSSKSVRNWIWDQNLVLIPLRLPASVEV